MYYPSSENKGTDQLRGYREADLRLCFRLCKLLVFQRGGSYIRVIIIITKGHFAPVNVHCKDIRKSFPGFNSFKPGVLFVGHRQTE